MEKKKILFVEDHKEYVEPVINYLRDKYNGEVEALWASCGVEAKEIIEREGASLDIVVLDGIFPYDRKGEEESPEEARDVDFCSAGIFGPGAAIAAHLIKDYEKVKIVGYSAGDPMDIGVGPIGILEDKGWDPEKAREAVFRRINQGRIKGKYPSIGRAKEKMKEDGSLAGMIAEYIIDFACKEV